MKFSTDEQGSHQGPAKHDRLAILNAILYLVRTGCAWRLLPHDMPSWKTVYHYFRCWRLRELVGALYGATRGRGPGHTRPGLHHRDLHRLCTPRGHRCLGGHVRYLPALVHSRRSRRTVGPPRAALAHGRSPSRRRQRCVSGSYGDCDLASRPQCAHRPTHSGDRGIECLAVAQAPSQLRVAGACRGAGWRRAVVAAMTLPDMPASDQIGHHMNSLIKYRRRLAEYHKLLQTP